MKIDYSGYGTIYNGDCLEVMKEIEDKSVDSIICDLPYGTTQNKWDTIIPFDKLWEQYKRIIKDNGAIVLFGSEPFSSHLRMSNIKMYKYDWIWIKERGTGFGNAKRQPLRKTENISIFYNNQCYYNPKLEELNKPYNHVLPIVDSSNYNGGYKSMRNQKRIVKKYTHSYPNNVLNFARPYNKNLLHPTQKPVALLEYLIKTYTNENELILDNTMGSGTTCVASINTNRKFIGIEQDEKYFNISKERIEDSLHYLKLFDN